MQFAGSIGKTKAQLSSAVIGDILDTMGRQRQFLPSYLRPLSEGTRLFGRAFTVLEADFVRRVVADVRALDKASKENLVAKALHDGMSAEEAFNKFGVL
jgi:regulator of RNase E activity RraA